MWIYNIDTLHFVEVNDAAISKYGYTRNEYLKMTIKDIRPPEDHQTVVESKSQEKYFLFRLMLIG